VVMVETGGHAVVVDFAKLCRDFSSLGGKPFQGTESVVEVHGWLKSCDSIFEDMGVEDAMKRRIAARNLQGAALTWWERVKIGNPGADLTWAEFKDRFETRFIPGAERAVMFKKFIELKKGNKTVAQYVAEFDDLAQYGAELIPTEVKKNEKFVNGLREDLGDQLLKNVYGGFDELVDLATRYEHRFEDRKSTVAKTEEIKPQVEKKRPFKGKDKKGKKGKPGNKADITCYACGKKGHYSNECRSKDSSAATSEKKCYGCHQTGHFIDKCPKKEGAVVKAYAVEAVPSSSVKPSAKEKGKNLVIEGMLLISDVPVRVLFDTGASRSFISSDLVDRLKLEPLVTEEPLKVSNPIGGPAYLSMICCDVRISFRDVVLPCDLYVLGFSGFGSLD